MNPQEIESIVVLKDDEATAIYGMQGANGVILIKTEKSSKADKRIRSKRFKVEPN
jgi:TonB-dependent SusC/RagA subfamily outer membrane receptor